MNVEANGQSAGPGHIAAGSQEHEHMAGHHHPADNKGQHIQAQKKVKPCGLDFYGIHGGRPKKKGPVKSGPFRYFSSLVRQ